MGFNVPTQPYEDHSDNQIIQIFTQNKCDPLRMMEDDRILNNLKRLYNHISRSIGIDHEISWGILEEICKYIFILEGDSDIY